MLAPGKHSDWKIRCALQHPRGKPFAQDNALLDRKKGTLNSQFSIKKALPFGAPFFISAPKASPGYVLVDAPTTGYDIFITMTAGILHTKSLSFSVVCGII